MRKPEVRPKIFMHCGISRHMLLESVLQFRNKGKKKILFPLMIKGA